MWSRADEGKPYMKIPRGSDDTVTGLLGTNVSGDGYRDRLRQRREIHHVLAGTVGRRDQEGGGDVMTRATGAVEL